MRAQFVVRLGRPGGPFDGDRPTERPSNLPEGVRWIRVDDYSNTPMTEGKTVIHLAESANASAYVAPAIAQKQITTLRALLAKPMARFVYVSSATVYGDHVATPRRTDEPAAAGTAYAKYKYAAEQEVLRAGGAVARPSNLYGPGMASNNVVSDIISQLGRQQGSFRVRNPYPVRDYLWIDDYTDGLLRLALGKASGPFNFAVESPPR